MNILTWLKNWLRRAETATVDEIMRPLTTIHTRLSARYTTAVNLKTEAEDAAKAKLAEAETHASEAKAALENQAVLSNLLGKPATPTVAAE